MIDLHTHTNISDGDLTPSELVVHAARQGIKFISITDHDTLDSYTSALFDLATANGLTLIPGIEMSTVDAKSSEKIHVLGLQIDLDNQDLRQTCTKLRQSREDYAHQVAKKLNLSNLEFDPTNLLRSGDIITKAHVARQVLATPANLTELTKRYGSVPLQGTFIEDYLIEGCPAFVPKNFELSSDEAVRLIKQAGGLSFCAHPSFNVMRGFDFISMKQLILRNEFDGVEAINIQYDKSNNDQRFDMVDQFVAFAKDSSLLVSGGSDYHSDNTQLWGDHSELGLANEPYRVQIDHLDAILNY